MWDELSAAAMVDPSIITGEKELYVDIDIDHGLVTVKRCSGIRGRHFLRMSGRRQFSSM